MNDLSSAPSYAVLEPLSARPDQYYDYDDDYDDDYYLLNSGCFGISVTPSVNRSAPPRAEFSSPYILAVCLLVDQWSATFNTTTTATSSRLHGTSQGPLLWCSVLEEGRLGGLTCAPLISGLQATLRRSKHIRHRHAMPDQREEISALKKPTLRSTHCLHQPC
ncbi:hypothetical protein VTO42DRAFT_5884 [Malbranchea cinnamomea]